MHEFELQTDPEEMDGDDAKATLAEFMEKHRENVEEYDELETDFSELEEEHDEQTEALAELRTKFAEEAAEYVNLAPDVIADRFSYSEILSIVEEGDNSEEFSEDEEPEDAEEDEEGQLTTFSQREEKGKRESTDVTSDYTDEARDRLNDKF